MEKEWLYNHESGSDKLLDAEKYGEEWVEGSWAHSYPSLEKPTALTHPLNQQHKLKLPKTSPMWSFPLPPLDANGPITHFSQLFPTKVKVAKTCITTAFLDLDLLSVATFVNEWYSLSMTYVSGSLETNRETQTQYYTENKISFLIPLKV